MAGVQVPDPPEHGLQLLLQPRSHLGGKQGPSWETACPPSHSSCSLQGARAAPSPASFRAQLARPLRGKLMGWQCTNRGAQLGKPGLLARARFPCPALSGLSTMWRRAPHPAGGLRAWGGKEEGVLGSPPYTEQELQGALPRERREAAASALTCCPLSSRSRCLTCSARCLLGYS